MSARGTAGTSRSVCSRCQEPIADGQKLCSCGNATGHMSFKERNEYELTQWRRHQSRATD
jgi:hypothetical protein